MKKIFTLIAAALMSMGASAQKTVHWEYDNTAIADGGGHVLAELPEIKLIAQMGDGASDLTWSHEALVNSDTSEATPKQATNLAGETISYPAWISAKGTNGRKNILTNANCAYFQFEPQYSGTIQVMVHNAGTNKEIVAGVIENGEFTAVPTTIYVDGTATAVEAAAQLVSVGVSANYTGYIDFAVEAGKTYTYCLNGSKGRIMGFSYTYTEGGSTGDDNAPANAAGLYRTQLEADYFSIQKTATTLGVTVETIMGTTTKDVDLDNDDVYGESTEMPRYLGSNVELEEGIGRIYPATELSEKNESSFIGFKMSIPEGKTVTVDKLVAQGFFGNAFLWCADIVKGGEILYTTNTLKVNNYNREYVWGDAINVTSTEISGLTEGAIAQIKNYVEQGWTNGITDPYEYAYSQGGCKAWGNLLTDAVENLSGDVEVKLYYWGKAKKAMALNNLYVVLSEGTTSGISSVATETTVSNGAIYNLAGQRVSAPVRGQIYIQNGKKFIQK